MITHPRPGREPLLDERGNVVGIAVMRYRGTSNRNFFIPIGDALDRLGVAIDWARSPLASDADYPANLLGSG